MRDTDTPLCECSGFQKTSKGRWWGEGSFGDKDPGVSSSALPYSRLSFPYLSYINIAKTRKLIRLSIEGVILTRK